MKNSNSKRLPKSLETICDFKKVRPKTSFGDTNPTGSDPTTATVTIIVTTATTQQPGKMLI